MTTNPLTIISNPLATWICPDGIPERDPKRVCWISRCVRPPHPKRICLGCGNVAREGQLCEDWGDYKSPLPQVNLNFDCLVFDDGKVTRYKTPTLAIFLFPYCFEAQHIHFLPCYFTILCYNASSRSAFDPLSALRCCVYLNERQVDSSAAA